MILQDGMYYLPKRNETKEQHWVVITDVENKVVRKMQVPSGKGLHRFTWDFSAENAMPINTGEKLNENKNGGFRVGPGTYRITLYYVHQGKATPLTTPKSFDVIPLYPGTLPSKNDGVKNTFIAQYVAVSSRKSLLEYDFNQAKKQASAMELALKRSPNSLGALESELVDLNNELRNLDLLLEGNPLKDEVGEKNIPTINERIWARQQCFVGRETVTAQLLQHSKVWDIAERMLADFDAKLAVIKLKAATIYEELKKIWCSCNKRNGVIM